MTVSSGLRALGVAMAFALSGSPAFAQKPGKPVPEPPPAFAAKGFQVVSHQVDATSGLRVWTVRHANGTLTILYSTPDNKAFFTGAMWDGATGNNISDAYYAPIVGAVGAAPVAPSVATAPVPARAAKPGAVPESIKRLALLKGFREGNAPPEKTLFVFFDPQCPYCKQFWEMTRDRPEFKGRSILWLPVAVLSNKPRGQALAADIMQSGSTDALKISFSGFGNANAKPSASTMSALTENEKIFYTAFSVNPNAGQPAVPVVFFMDKTGNPQMVPSPGTPQTFNKMLAEMN